MSDLEIPGAGGSANVSDAAYDATAWDGDTDAPTKNAVRDKIETLGVGHDPVTVTDSDEINFTLTGQGITAVLKAGSIVAGRLATAVQTSLGKADSAQQPPSEGAFVDGDKTKLDTYSEANQTANNAKISFDSTASTKLGTIETNADVTDTANVAAAGALMDSELTSIADVKALDQSVVSGAAPVFDGTNFTNIPAGTVSVVSNVATARILGRTAAGTGDSEELTAAATRTLLNVEDGATADQDLSGLAPKASPTFTGTVAGITAADVGLGNVDNTSNATERAATATLENKRIQPRVSSSASGNITPTKVDFDRYIRTAQAAAITISNPTMDIGEVMAVQLTDNATARAITFGTHYMALDGLALPTTTTASKVMAMVLEKVTATKVLVSYVEEA